MGARGASLTFGAVAHEALNAKPEALNLKPEALKPKPETLYSKPKKKTQTLNPLFKTEKNLKP